MSGQRYLGERKVKAMQAPLGCGSNQTSPPCALTKPWQIARPPCPGDTRQGHFPGVEAFKDAPRYTQVGYLDLDHARATTMCCPSIPR